MPCARGYALLSHFESRARRRLVAARGNNTSTGTTRGMPAGHLRPRAPAPAPAPAPPPAATAAGGRRWGKRWRRNLARAPLLVRSTFKFEGSPLRWARRAIVALALLRRILEVQPMDREAKRVGESV
jgi:hypothetical protein